MNTSIAMATYNGAAHLAEQLQSIAAQEQLPDELVVCDDRSTDDTPKIVRRFAASAPFAVRLEVNERTLGVAGNFAKAVELCRGEWIALADQDDYWLPCKLRRLHEAAASCRGTGFAFSDAALVDSQRRPLNRRLWQSIRFDASERRAFRAGREVSVLLRHNVVTGATMLFRAEFRDLLLPVAAGWVHDGWFALLIAAVARGVAVDEPLIEYRQHPQQQIGAGAATLFGQYLRARGRTRDHFASVATMHEAAAERLAAHRGRLRDPAVVEEVLEKARHFRAKARMRQSRLRLPAIGRELLLRHYQRYSTGWRSLAQDLFL